MMVEAVLDVNPGMFSTASLWMLGREAEWKDLRTVRMKRLINLSSADFLNHS
jgi:hypothetical protein